MQPVKILPILSLTLILLLIPRTPGAAQNNARRAAQDAGGGTVVFSVTKYPDDATVQMEPIVVISGGKYTQPPVDVEPRVTKKFTDTYFRTGRRYRVVFGGGDAGSLTVKKEVEGGCVFLMAEVVVQTTARLGGQVQALAVSTDNIGRGESSRRAPTEGERTSAVEVARVVYGQRGVAAALVKKMKTVNLTATDIERDGKFELIGNFEIQGENEVAYNLFIIFEPTDAGKYKAAWNWYHKGVEEGYEDRSLVDVVDLDGDGMAEVIAEGHYYESNDYVIYKRQAGTWRPVYKGGGGGC
jgi:hypothetical protein